MSRYLVTGGAGFIGSHLVENLVQDGHEVVVVDNFSTGYPHNLAHLLDRISLHKVDIRDLDQVRTAMQGVEYVYHQAALASVPRSVADPLNSHDANMNGTMNVLLAARDAHVKRLVYAGSSSAYGDIDTEYKSEEMRPRVKSPYAANKLAGEHYCLAFNAVYDLETVVIRYFNVFGPRQDPDSPYAAVIPIFATLMAQGKSPTVHGDGLQSRDFTYIDNVIYGNRLAMASPNAPGEVFNIACGERISLRQLVDELNQLLGTAIVPTFGAPRVGDVMHSRASIDKARKLLDYEPKVSFAEGLARTLNWYLQQQ